MKMPQYSLIALALTALLAGCDNGASVAPEKQIGANPELPEAKKFYGTADAGAQRCSVEERRNA